MGQLRGHIGQNLCRDRRIGLLGRRARIGQLAIEQRAAVKGNAHAAQLRVHRCLRIGPVHRLDQHQIGIGDVLRHIDALIRTRSPPCQTRLGGETLAGLNRQGARRCSDGAIARVQLHPVAGHHCRVACRRMREDPVQRLDIHRAGRRGHFLQKGLGACAALREIGQTDIVAGFGTGIARRTQDIELNCAAQGQGRHIDCRPIRRNLAIRLTHQNTHIAPGGDRCGLGRRHRLDVDALTIADGDVAPQGDIAIAADIDRVGLRAGTQESEVDILRSRHIESEELLLLFLDNLRQRRGLHAQPAPAAMVGAFVAQNDVCVELTIADHKAGAIDLLIRARHIARHDYVIELAAALQLPLQDIRHGRSIGIGHDGRHQHRTRLGVDHGGPGLGGVAVGQPAQRIDILANQVQVLGDINRGGGIAGVPPHDPHHDLTRCGLVSGGQSIAQAAHQGGLAFAIPHALAIVVDPDPARLAQTRVAHLNEFVPDRVHDLVLAIEFVEIALAARRIDNVDAATAVGAYIDVARHQGIVGLIIDMH